MFESKLNKYMVIFLMLGILIQRLSMAAGNVFYGLTILCFLLILKKEYKNNNIILQEEYQGVYQAFAIMLISFLPAIVLSSDVVVSVKSVAGIWLYRAMYFFIITLFIKDSELIKKILGIWMVGLSIDSLVAVGQYLFLNIRGWGFGGNALTLPGILCMLMPILLILILDDRVSSKVKKFSGIIMFLCTMGLVAGLSRGAWLDLLILLPLVSSPYIVKSKKKFFCLIACLMVVGGFFFTQPAFKGRLVSAVNVTTNTSNLARIYVWQSAIEMIKDNPAVGIGPGRFREAYQPYRDVREKNNLVHTHNGFLQIAVENGIVGLVGAVMFFGYICFNNFKNWLVTRNPYALMIVSSTIGLLLNSMTDNVLDNSSIDKTFWFLLACLLVLKKHYQDTETF